MRIAILSDGVHPYVMGGMQRHTFYLCRSLSRAGVKITLLHFNRSGLDISALDVFSEEEKKNIESIVLSFPVSSGLPGHYLRASYRYSEAIFETLNGRWKEFDYIYAKGFSAWKLLEEKQKNPKAFPPVGVKFHGYEMFQKQADLPSFLRSLLLRRPVRWISRHADQVFSYGGGISDIIRSLGVNENRIIEIPAGIDPSWIRKETRSGQPVRTFTYLGRYERRKGIEELNAVLQDLIGMGLPFRFHFIGPFEENHKLRAPQLHYYGALSDNAQIARVLDGSDFLVCPSWSEGMPNVILEAMARSCAIIATRVGAVPVMAGEDNALLIPPGNPAALKAALLQALQMEPAELQRLQAASLKKIRERFQYQYIIDLFLHHINHILQNHENR